MAHAPTIDTHAHYFPQSYLDLIAQHGPRVVVVAKGLDKVPAGATSVAFRPDRIRNVS